MGSYPSVLCDVLPIKQGARVINSGKISDTFARSMLERLPVQYILQLLADDAFALKCFSEYVFVNKVIFGSLLMDVSSCATACALKQKFAKIVLCSTGSDQFDNNFVEFLRGTFPTFLKSQFFIEWRKELSSDFMIEMDAKFSNKTTLPELYPDFCTFPPAEVHLCNDFGYEPQVTKVIPLNDMSSSLREKLSYLDNEPTVVLDSLPCVSITRRALASCDQMKLVDMNDSCPWMLSLLAVAETLPVAITVSGVTSVLNDYPLIYVNQKHAKVSGLNREELIGTSSVFLQTRYSLSLPNQRETMAKFFKHINQGQTCIGSLVCGSSAFVGSLFSNVVGVVPIMDHMDNIRYLMTIQVDETVPLTSREKSTLLEQVIISIPQRLDGVMSAR